MAERYISSCVNIDQRYWISRKNTNRAERISPTPILNRTRKNMGYRRKISFHVNVMPSRTQSRKKTQRVSPKLINV